MKSTAVFSRVLIALALVATACGSASDPSNPTVVPSPQASPPSEAAPAADAGPSRDEGPDAAGAAADAATEAAPTYIKASNTRDGARFGIVALDGDTLAVGALGESSAATTINGNEEDASAPLAGAVYVFKRAEGTWTQEAYLKASNNRAGAAFGVSLALKGDTLAVGALYESSNGVDGPNDTSAPNAGAVYVFKRTGGTWAQQAYLKASNTRAGAEFGTSVALSGDTLAVGSAMETSNATGVGNDPSDTSLSGAGAAYVFTRSGEVWTQQAYLKASNTRADALFGSSVSLEGDTLAVGSLHESSGTRGINGDQSDTSVPGAGAAYVFTRTGTTWSQQAYLKASNTQPAADLTGGFSIGLSLSGDTLAVGGFIEASNAKGINGDQSATSAPNAGAVYVFNRSGTEWSQQAYLKASNARPLALFGYSVALSGNDLIVGSVNESSSAKGLNGNQDDTSTTSAGAAYRFKRTGTTWSQQAYLKATNTRQEAVFGYTVAVAGDTFAVGSVFESSAAKGVGGNASDTSAPTSGAVYVYR